jgi:hypothetical protein
MNIWRYDGTWSQIPDPFEGSTEQNWGRLLEAHGYTRSDDWGYSIDAPVTIWSHGWDEQWLVEWTIDGSHVQTVEVHGLPNLIDLAAKLSTIALAHQAAALQIDMDDAIEVVSENGRRVYRRRNPAHRRVG